MRRPSGLLLRGVAQSRCPSSRPQAHVDSNPICRLARVGLVRGNASEPARYPEPSGNDADRQRGIARDARVWRAWDFAALDRGNTSGDIMGSLIASSSAGPLWCRRTLILSDKRIACGAGLPHVFEVPPKTLAAIRSAVIHSVVLPGSATTVDGFWKRCACTGCSAETGSEAGKVFSIASSSTFSPCLRSASLLIFVMNFLDFGCDSFCGISIASPLFLPLSRHQGARLVPCKRQCFDHGDAVLNCLLYLLERVHVDLADALGRDAEFGGQVGKCGRVLGEPTRFKDAPLAIIEHAEHRVEGLAAIVAFVTRGERSLLVSSFINQPVLPFAGIAFLADRRVERGVAAKPPVHVDHVAFRDAKPHGNDLDLVMSHIAVVDD